MKILIFGNGYIGNIFHNYFENSIISKKRILSTQDALEEIKKENPDVVINAIAKSGIKNIDWCEEHKEETLFSNAIVPFLIYDACKMANVFFVQIGTGCIFEGDNNGVGFSELDEPNFEASFYSRSKIVMEKMLKDFSFLLIRIRLPIDKISHSRNTLTKLLSFDKVTNIQNSVTVIPSILPAIKFLIDNRAIGVFNCTNPGSISHKEILEIYNEVKNSDKPINTFSIEEESKILKAPRSNCVLNVDKLNKIYPLTPVKDAIFELVKQYK